MYYFNFYTKIKNKINKKYNKIMFNIINLMLVYNSFDKYENTINTIFKWFCLYNNIMNIL